MYSATPCITSCVIDGALVTFTYHPDTCVLRVSDATGQCLREDRWDGGWPQLLAHVRELGQASSLEDDDAVRTPEPAANQDAIAA